MTMTNTRPPARQSAYADLMKAAAHIVVMIWMLALLFFLASLLAYAATGSPYGRQWATLYSVVVLFISTPLVLLFSVPILIKYYPRQPRSPERMGHDRTGHDVTELRNDRIRHDATELRDDWIRHATTESPASDRTSHAVTETQTPVQTKSDARQFPGFVKGSAIAGAMTWVLSLLALLTAKPYGSGFDGLAALLLLTLATLFLVLFVLPASIISFVRRR